MKKMTKMLCALLCGVLLCGAVAVAMPKENSAATAAPVRKQIVLEPDKPRSATMKIGEQVKLSISYVGDRTKSDNQAEGSGESPSQDTQWGILEGGNAVEIDAETGVVTAKKVGTATVGKILADGRKVSCTVTVSGYAVETMTIEGTQEMCVGEMQTLNLSITPSEARDDAKITWKSDNPDILSVNDNGTVTAYRAGSATITATAGNVTAKLTISVESDVKSLTIKPSSTKMFVGDSIAVQVTPTPADADIASAQWESEDASIAYYKDGRIYGVRAGTTRITVSVGGVTASCTVTVQDGHAQPDNKPDNQPNHNNQPTPAPQPSKQPSSPSSKPSTGSNTGNTLTKPITGVGSQFTYVPNTGNTFLYMPGSTVTVTEFAYTMPKNIPEAVYLTIDSKLDDVAGSIADTLSASGMQATFFVSTENLYGSDDMLRHLTGDGNSIGLLLTPEQANSGNAVALLDQANKQLSVITGMPTRLVRISSGTSGNINSETLNTLLNAGYRVWDWNTSANESSQAADASYQAVSKAIDTTGTPAVRFDGSVATDTVLRQLLPYMKYCGIQTRAIQASDNAVCNTTAG